MHSTLMHSTLEGTMKTLRLTTTLFVGMTTACSGTPSGNSNLTVADTLTRAQAVAGQYISWKEHIVDDESIGGVAIRGSDGLEIGDLDQDGHIDIVSVHEADTTYDGRPLGHVRIAFGSPDPDRWALTTLAEGAEAGAAEDVAIGDMNGDGFPDVVVACELAHLIYFQNPGKDIRTADWQRVIPDVANNRGSFIRVFVADFDQDGRLEVVAANKGGQNPIPGQKDLAPISWFEVPEDPLDGARWKEHELTRVQVPINSKPVDMDGDGDLDILGGSRFEARMMWFENISEGSIQFLQHRIEVTGRNAEPEPIGRYLTGMDIEFVDLNQDGRLDLVTQETTWLLVWVEQPKDFADPWRIHVIGATTPDATDGLALGDINDDGRIDVITGGYSGGPRDRDGEGITVHDYVGRIAWFENPGDLTIPWPRHDISRRKRGMYDKFIARDMDDDGDIDFISTRGNSVPYDGVFWLEQIRTENPVKAFEPARQSESAHLPLPPDQTTD